MLTLPLQSQPDASLLPSTGTVHKATLDLRLEPNSEAFELSQVRAVQADARGNIYVLDWSDQTVRMFNSAGRAVRTFGRKGQGPGEFVTASSIEVLRDSIWVLDRSNDRVNVFPISGNGVRSFHVPGTGPNQKRILAIGANGFYCVTAARRGGASSSNQSSDIVRVSATGAVLGTVFSDIPPVRSLIFTASPPGNSNGSFRSFTKQPFLHSTAWRLTDNATAVVSVETVITSGKETDRIRVSKLNSKGEKVWDRVLRYNARTLSAAHVNTFIDSVVKASPVVRGVTLVPNRKMLEDSVIRTAYLPPVSQMIVGIDGTIWLKQNYQTTTSNRYWRLSPTGSFEAIVELPKGFELAAATRYSQWGWRIDEDGLPVVERYKLTQR